MAGRMTNTDKIDILQSQSANMAARLDVHDNLIQGLKSVLEKSTEVTQGHTSRITIVEERILVLVNLKEMQAAITAIEKESLAFRKDLEAMQTWKEELKQEKAEATRRRWAFGPSVTAAIISGIISLIGVGINILFNYLLRKP